MAKLIGSLAVGWPLQAALFSISAAILSMPLGVNATVLWYSGDMGKPCVDWCALGNGLNDFGTAKTFQMFTVDSAEGWTVMQIWSNNTGLAYHVLPVEQAEWSIRSGMGPGNPGVILFNGIAPVSLTPTGRSWSTNPWDVEYMTKIEGLNIVLPGGDYWLQVTPFESSSPTAGPEPFAAVSVTHGDNSVNSVKSNSALYLYGNVVSPPIPGSLYYYASMGVDVSMGVAGVVGAIPEVDARTSSLIGLIMLCLAALRRPGAQSRSMSAS